MLGRLNCIHFLLHLNFHLQKSNFCVRHPKLRAITRGTGMHDASVTMQQCCTGLHCHEWCDYRRKHCLSVSNREILVIQDLVCFCLQAPQFCTFISGWWCKSLPAITVAHHKYTSCKQQETVQINRSYLQRLCERRL